MYAHQARLARLPLPPLADTLDRYWKSVQPFLDTPEAAERTKKEVAEFLTGAGPGLQAQLEALRSATHPHSSWMEGFWDSMYLEIREPSAIHVNPGFVLSSNPAQSTAELQALLHNAYDPQITRAAQLAQASAEFACKIRDGVLPVDWADKTTPLDMSQYPNLFAASKLPGYNRDTWKHSWSINKYKTWHAVVLCEGQYFKVAVLSPRDGRALSVRAIAAQLHSARRLAHAQKYNPAANHFSPVGLLTSEERWVWSTVYPALQALPGNAHALATVEDALFAICLDSTSPEDLQEAGQEALHSDGRNRWYDKSIQLLIAPDATAAINFEHTAFDGHTVLTYVEAIHNSKYDASTVGGPETVAPPAEQIFFHLDAPLKTAIARAGEKFQNLVSTVESSYKAYGKYGKRFITSHGLSPDATVQAALQIAQVRTFGKVVSTYESSMVKHFNRGRTETVRSVTAEAKKLALGFDRPDWDDQTKLQALKDSVAAHGQEAKKSKVGQCVDRHLQGLKWSAIQQMARQNGYQYPSIFTDPSFAAMTANKLSTSNCGSNALEVFTFGPVCGDGLGVGYMIKDLSLPFNVTSFQARAHDYTTNLAKTLDDIQALLNRASTPVAKKQ